MQGAPAMCPPLLQSLLHTLVHFIFGGLSDIGIIILTLQGGNDTWRMKENIPKSDNTCQSQDSR